LPTTYIIFSMLTSYVEKIIGIIGVDVDVIDQLLTKHFTFVIYWRNNES